MSLWDDVGKQDVVRSQLIVMNEYPSKTKWVFSKQRKSELLTFPIEKSHYPPPHMWQMSRSSPYLIDRMALTWHAVAPKSFKNSAYRNESACLHFAIIPPVSSTKYKRIKKCLVWHCMIFSLVFFVRPWFSLHPSTQAYCF